MSAISSQPHSRVRLASRNSLTKVTLPVWLLIRICATETCLFLTKRSNSKAFAAVQGIKNRLTEGKKSSLCSPSRLSAYRDQEVAPTVKNIHVGATSTLRWEWFFTKSTPYVWMITQLRVRILMRIH